VYDLPTIEQYTALLQAIPALKALSMRTTLDFGQWFHWSALISAGLHFVESMILVNYLLHGNIPENAGFEANHVNFFHHPDFGE
jgi:hypothetical protein